jgi:hypothetical protein
MTLSLRGEFTYMVRRGQQAKRDLRRANRKLEEDIAQPRGDYDPVSRDQCEERSRVFLVDDGYEFRVVLHYWRHKGETTEFVYLFQRRVWNEWENVARIDCKHGSCHIHDPDDEGATEHLTRLDSIDDVRQAMKTAQARARKMFEEMERGEAA